MPLLLDYAERMAIFTSNSLLRLVLRYRMECKGFFICNIGIF